MSYDGCVIPVYQAQTLPEAELFRQRLQELGIEATLRNVHLRGAIGELPANLYPEVCVLHEKDFAAAREEVQKLETDLHAPEKPERPCEACGEANPANFEVCWKCRTEFPESR